MKRDCLLHLLCLAALVSSAVLAEVAPLDPESAAGGGGGDDEDAPGLLVAGRHRRPLPAPGGAETALGAAAADGGGGGGAAVAENDDDTNLQKPGVDGPSVTHVISGKPGEFVHGFIATLSVIIVSELGDKTFFIAAIMAMRHARLTVFTGAISALTVMHVMSAFFGYAITVIPRLYTYYVSSFLFAVFGIKMLKEGWRMSANEAQEEMEEVQEDLRKRDMEKDKADDPEVGGSGGLGGIEHTVVVSRVFVQAFTMTFLAEWGDRSQLATIVLAAREEIKSVVLGGVLGHSLCTGLAVLGGRFIAQRISVRTVTLVGGVVFLMFAMTALFMDPNET